MQIGIHKHSVLNKNGQNILVDTFRWAINTLTGDTLNKFLSDWNEHITYLNGKIRQNKVHQEEIFEEVNIDENTYRISIGFKLTVFDPNGYNDHPAAIYWMEQMRLDPNIVEFNAPYVMEN